MRFLTSLRALTTGAMAAMTAGGAFAQDLAILGAPTPKGTGFQFAATELARDIHDLDYMILVIITAIVIFVTALLIVVMIRFNRKRNPTPSTFTHNSVLEIGWTLVPILILVVIGAFSLPVLFKQLEIPASDLTVKVTGNQWYWNYQYPDDDVEFDSFLIGDGKIMTPEVEAELVAAGYSKEDFLLASDTALVVPVNKVVRVQLTGSDVIHAWMVPALGMQMSAVPGRLSEMWFKAEHEGIYFGQCSTLCGKDHAYMPITVKVVSQAVYDKWLEAAKAGDVALASNAATALQVASSN